MIHEKEITKPVKLIFAINPTIGIDLIGQTATMTRLEEYLSDALNLAVEVRLPQSYEETLSGLAQGEIDAAQLGPYAFALAQARFGATALVNTVEIASLDEKDSPAPYRSVIFTRSDSGLTGLAQLKGQPFGFVDRNSTTGYLVATFLLQQGGLDPVNGIEPVFLYSHRAVAEGVLAGELAAGATMETEFVRQNQPIARPPLRLLAASPLISKGPVVIRPGLAASLERRLLNALVRLSQDEPEAARLLLPPTQRFAPATQRELTLKSIAELAGVSYGTVSRAINGRDRIAPATTARVLKLVEELGYRPNANARSLHKLRGDLVGLALPALSYPGLDAIIAGLQATLEEAQLQLLIYSLGQTDHPGRHKAYFEMLYDGRLEGTLLTQWSMLDLAVTGLIRSGKPTALLEQDLLESGLRTAWQWLAGQGYRQVGLATGKGSLLEPSVTSHTFKRLTNTECRLFSLDDLTPENTRPIEPTALFCPDDEIALAVQNRLAESKLPLCVLGLGDSLAKRQARLPFLAFDGEAVGRAAAGRLLTLLNLPSPEPGSDLRFWVEGG